MQSQPAGPEAGERVLFDARAQQGASALQEHFGSRLRAAREARGLEIESCGQALRLPVRVLRQLEGGDYAGIDYQVYLAGYLSKYGRHVGVDEAAIQAELARLSPVEPTLVATGGISHSRYLLERYARAATYVVLTAAIVVPTIWLGVRGTLDRDVTHLAPLDAKPVAQADLPASSASAAATQVTSSQATAAPKPTEPSAEAQEQPLLASMAPFPNLGSNNDAIQPKDPAKTAPVGEGAHSLSLELPNASWVEVVAQDGSRLEYGLLPAGTSKTYRSDKPLVVRIGNASGAQVSLDGQPIALDSYRRSNVAHFKVDVRDGKATPSGA